MHYLSTLIVVSTLCCLVHSAKVPVKYVSHKDCNGLPEGTFIAHPGNCHQFVQCHGLRSLLGECPDGTYFNPLVYSCDRSRQACDANKQLKLKLKEQQKDKNNIELQQDDVETTVKPYIELEVPSMQAPQADEFNATTTTTTTVTTPTTYSIQKVSTKLVNTVTRRPSLSSVDHSAARPVCTYWLDEHLPHPVKCEYYYNCRRGYLTIRRCYNGFGWDFERKRCVPLHMAKCFGQI